MNAANISTGSSNNVPFRILVAGDEPEVRDRFQLALRRPNFVVDFAECGEAVLNALGNGINTPALIILDVANARDQAMTILRAIRFRKHSQPVILLSSGSSDANREEAIEGGADDVLAKPVSGEDLRQAVENLLPRDSFAHVPRRSAASSGRPEMNIRIGNWTRKMEPLLSRLAASDVPVLLQGETGVGKEVLARYIHNQSLRAGKVFLKLNCAALPSELVESELFGYEKGAFTGAFRSTPGKFELANGGTILLDEIGDMDLRLQAKLLQVLQDREFHRIGAKDSTQVDVRVIAATHRRLEERIEEGEFREDLYYRLNVFNVVIPPLRERSDEIIPLATSFLKKHSMGELPVPEIGAGLRAALLNHRWHGNIRELENVMRRYLVVRNAEMIIEELQAIGRRAGTGFAGSENIRNGAHTTSQMNATHVPGGFGIAQPDGSAERNGRGFALSGQYSTAAKNGSSAVPVNLDEVRHAAESEVIMKALYSTQWNRKRAAVMLGVDYKALLYKMKKLGID